MGGRQANQDEKQADGALQSRPPPEAGKTGGKPPEKEPTKRPLPRQ